MSNLKIALRNLYIDREITGESLLIPHKRYTKWIQESIAGNDCLSKTARLICKIVGSSLTGALAIVGMAVKCIHVHQVKVHNEKVRQHLIYRQVLNDYPNQMDTVYRLPIQEQNNFDARNAALAKVDQCNDVWERCAWNILGYPGINEVWIQFIEQTPRWQIPEGVVRPFEA